MQRRLSAALFLALQFLSPAINAQVKAPDEKDVQSSAHPNVKKNLKDDAEMIFIPAGKFIMGTDDFNASTPLLFAKPSHEVNLTGYYIYRTPVTVAQYRRFCDATGHEMSKISYPCVNEPEENCPVAHVSWDDAQAYCKWAGVRLPTEAQWEKAASWDDAKKHKRKFPWGDVFDKNKLRCSNGGDVEGEGPKPVGSYPTGASAYGILAMAGNVWQWCSDYYDENFYSNPLATKENPENQSVGPMKFRVMRGGSFKYISADHFLTTNRYSILPNTEYDQWYLDVGFRCVSVP